MRVVVTLPPAVAAYLADRRDWLAHDALVDGHAPTAWRVAVVTAAHAAHRYTAWAEGLVCGPDVDAGDDDRRVGFLPGHDAARAAAMARLAALRADIKARAARRRS